ncbi:MAG: hypothetical protein E5V75_03265 [Mesorhizobium sp.]|nr:MAG: hypothetical protein E5V75_03265 [Mesorhizobium sp.]
MKSGWELKFDDRRWASGIAGAIVLLISAFVYAFFSQADATFATAFSKTFSLKADLGRCSSSFADLIMAQIVYALATCLVLLGLAIAMGVAAITDTPNRSRYLKLLLATLAFLLLLLAFAMNDDGFWLSSTSRRSFGRRLSFVDACVQSHNTNFIRLYVMSVWLAFGSWMLILMELLYFRAILFRRNYDELPENPQLRAEILAIRSKYGAVNQTLKKPTWTFSMLVFVGLLLTFVAHGLYKVAVVLGVI